MGNIVTALRITGLIAILGAFLYSIGDVLLLASMANLDDYPKLKPFPKLLSDTEKMVVLSPKCMMSGALTGVFSTPLILLGYGLVYQGLGGGNDWAVLATVGLSGSASVIGSFVHGSFFYLGEYVQALNNVEEKSQSVIASRIERHKKVMLITYVPLLIFIIPNLDGRHHAADNDHCMDADQTHPSAIHPRLDRGSWIQHCLHDIFYTHDHSTLEYLK